MPTPLVDLERDQLISVTDACQILPSRPSPATRWRWIRKGVRGVKLEAYQVRGVWYTTRKAFAEFIRAQTEATLTKPSDGLHRAGDDELKERGLL